MRARRATPALAGALWLALAGPSVVACGNDSMSDRADEAVEELRDEADDAADRVREGAEDAGDEIQDEVDDHS